MPPGPASGGSSPLNPARVRPPTEFPRRPFGPRGRPAPLTAATNCAGDETLLDADDLLPECGSSASLTTCGSAAASRAREIESVRSEFSAIPLRRVHSLDHAGDPNSSHAQPVAHRAAGFCISRGGVSTRSASRSAGRESSRKQTFGLCAALACSGTPP